jgi:type II secretory pathway pseudopilin PulG
MEAVQRRAREQSQEEQRVRLRQAKLAARHAAHDAGRVVVVREEDSTLHDPRLTMALNATPEGSAMVVTSVPSQQPPPETLDLGASLWANSLLLQRGGASAPVVGGGGST